LPNVGCAIIGGWQDGLNCEKMIPRISLLVHSIFYWYKLSVSSESDESKYSVVSKFIINNWKDVEKPVIDEQALINTSDCAPRRIPTCLRR